MLVQEEELGSVIQAVTAVRSLVVEACRGRIVTIGSVGGFVNDLNRPTIPLSPVSFPLHRLHCRRCSPRRWGSACTCLGEGVVSGVGVGGEVGAEVTAWEEERSVGVRPGQCLLRWLNDGWNSLFLDLILYQLMQKTKEWTPIEPSFNHRNKHRQGLITTQHNLQLWVENITDVCLSTPVIINICQ